MDSLLPCLYCSSWKLSGVLVQPIPRIALMKAATKNTAISKRTINVTTDETPAAAITHNQDAETSPITFNSDVVVKHVTTTIAVMMAPHLRRILVSSSCVLKTLSVLLLTPDASISVLSALVLDSVSMISVLLSVLVVQVLNPSVQDRVTNRLHYRHGGDDKGKTEQDCRNNKPPRNRDDVSDPEHDGSRDSANAQDETSERGHRQEDLADPGNMSNPAGK